MNPYEALANGIITQAADDYRRAVKFLKKHQHTEELEADVATQLADKKKRRMECKKQKLPQEREKKSKEERLLDSIRSNEQMAKETESFFHSEWFSQLTAIDGHWLFERIKKEMEDK